jgi:hypothetical protein
MVLYPNSFLVSTTLRKINKFKEFKAQKKNKLWNDVLYDENKHT